MYIAKHYKKHNKNNIPVIRESATHTGGVNPLSIGVHGV